jgi:TetR/AcrR family transcriptional regulator, repressor of fatR-cypB operon
MLEAARVVFAEKGYARATLDEIAQRAEFGKGTLYNYFEGGKDAMLRAILDEVFDEMVALVEKSFAGSTTFRESLHRFVRGCMELFESRRDVFIILMKEMHRMILSDDPERAHYVNEQHSRLIGALLPQLARFQSVGVVRKGAPDALAHTILGNIQGVQMHLCLDQCNGGASTEFTPTAAADFITSLLLDGMLEREHADSTTLST